MSEQVFFHGEPISVGDKVWSVPYGWLRVIDIKLNHAFPIKLENSRGSFYNCTCNGRETTDDLAPSFFWDEVSIVPPKKPRKKVMKYKWVFKNIHNGDLNVSGRWYATAEEFDHKNGYGVAIQRIESTGEMYDE